MTHGAVRRQRNGGRGHNVQKQPGRRDGFKSGVGVCLSEIESGHIRDAIRQGPGGKEYALPSLQCAIGEHPCPRPSACASHYSSERKISESGVDVPRLRQ
jgi:hypothetical protein